MAGLARSSAFAALGLLLSLAAWLPARRLGAFAMVYMLRGWLTGELALQHLAWQALATLGFALAGAFESAPGVAGLALTFASWGLLLASHLRGVQRAEVRGALAPLGSRPTPTSRRCTASAGRSACGATASRRSANVEYGAPLPGDKGRRNLLDVVRPSAPGERRPALLQIHGGGWVIGDKREQGQPLMTHLASRGWVCFAINYRLSPQATFPDHIVDVKRAIRWIREHAAEYGADPDFLCVTGGSAGGHLAALAAVSANDPRFQPGFEDVDTRLAAAVPFYGVYDFLDRFGIRGSQKMEPLPRQAGAEVHARREPRAVGGRLPDRARLGRGAALPAGARHARLAGLDRGDARLRRRRSPRSRASPCSRSSSRAGSTPSTPSTRRAPRTPCAR